jgi:RsiW-degrading membrane proteinase PrsW (M82 family)
MDFLISIKDAVIDNSLFFAPFFGVLPALIWLWFWLKEDIHHEPNKFIVFTFLLGMLSVVVALPMQKIALNIIGQKTFFLFFLWATIEEVLKFLAGFIGGIHSKADDEPIDPIIYMIVSALGFVALENTFFLINPLQTGNLLETFITGHMRFIGATLLHVMSSSVVGLFIGLAFYKTNLWKRFYGFIGLIIAIILHTGFNLFIVNWTSGNIFVIFGFVWFGIVGLMLLFEWIKNKRTDQTKLV